MPATDQANPHVVTSRAHGKMLTHAAAENPLTMIIKDSFTLNAPREKVWEFLQDIPRVGTCVPGVEGIEQIEPDVYRGQLKVRVGPIKASFGGKVSILERTPLERIVALVEGNDSASATQVKATFTAALVAVAAGTRVDYEMDVALRGRLAQFGATVFQATAKKITAEFARQVEQAL